MITMSSLLAGLFIASGSREISFDTINKMINDFFKIGIDVNDTDDDIDSIYLVVRFSDKRINLNYNYTDLIKIGDKEIMVYEYLYDLTDNLTRDYFDIDKCMLKTFNNKKRTKVIAS